MKISLHDNVMVAELARQQSIETGEKVYAVCPAGNDAVYVGGEMRRWAYIDDIEIIYHDDDSAKWREFLHGTEH